MYVAGSSRIPNAHNLTNRDDSVIAASLRSLGRGGTEYVYLNSAQAGEVFYIGIKSEDQQAANFSIYAESRNGPFSSTDDNGNVILSAIGPVEIPDGTAEDPGGTNMFMFVLEPGATEKIVQRVYVTNSIYHEQAGDIIGILSRPGGTNAVTLNNHRTWTEFETPQGFVIYDDSEQGDLDSYIPTPIPPDGPGRLLDFLGEQAGPAWNFTVSDNSEFHTGYVNSITLTIEPTSTNNSDANVLVDRRFCIGPGGFVYVPVNIPSDAVNMETCLSDFESVVLNPIQVFIRQGTFPTRQIYDHFFERLPPGAPCFDLGLGDNPPLVPARWYIGMFNPNLDSVCLHLKVTISRQSIPTPYSIFASTDTPKMLLDDATTNSTLFINQTGRIADLRVGLRVAHERASDLAFHLRSPRGTRVLLMENRGRTNELGIGANATNVVTNVFRTLINDGFDLHPSRDASSNQVIVGTGTILSGWQVEGDDVDIACCGAGIAFGTPAHSGSNALDLAGVQPNGAIASNVTTVVGQQYLLSFVHTKNPDPFIGSVSAGVEIDGQPVLTFVSSLPNHYTNLNWSATSLVFQATSTNTKIGFRQLTTPSNDGGTYLDTIKLQHVEIKTNLFLYTTFTENTNLTLTPIKFGIPPFTNSPNPQATLLLDDGFEFLSTNILAGPFGLAYPTIISGWLVEEGTVDIVDASSAGSPMDSGTYGIDINGYNAGRISTNVITETGVDYLLTFAFQKSPNPNIASAQAEVYLEGATVLTNILIDTTNVTWMTTSLVFTAQSPVTRLFLRSLTAGAAGMFFDSFKIQKVTAALSSDSAYFLPEEPLTPLFGEQSFGEWSLEVWDSRLGATLGASELVSWRLEIAYPQFNPPLVALTNGQTSTNWVVGDGTVYFSVPVSCDVGTLTNTLQNLTGAGGLDLSFNQYTLPTNGPNDVLLLNNVLGTASTNLTTGVPPLVLPTRYYLAVRNTDPSQSNQFTLRIDEICASNNVIALFTNVCRTITATATDSYIYNLPPGLIAVRFETYNLSGNVDLFVRFGPTPPIPGLVGLSNVMAGTAGEAIQSTTNQNPYRVDPGQWSVLVVNQETNDVSYCLEVTEYRTNDILPLILGVPLPQSGTGPQTTFYVVNVDTNYCGVTFAAGTATNGLLVAATYGRLPGANDNYQPTPPGFGPLVPPYPAGNWYVAVVNTNPVAQAFDVLAGTNSCYPTNWPVLYVDQSSFQPTNGFFLQWLAAPNLEYQVQYTDSLPATNWQTLTNVISSPTTNVNFLHVDMPTTNAQRFYRLIKAP